MFRDSERPRLAAVSRYLPPGGLAELWRDRLAEFGARELGTGRSEEGRPLRAYELGSPGGQAVLLSGLMHGVELIGSVALLHVVEALVKEPWFTQFRWVVAPVVNPDALADNTDRLSRGRLAFRRCNARGVDLNRNFGRVSPGASLHPFAGSRFRWAPHYVGDRAFSEAESRWLADLARRVRPALSLGFHSFGNLVLYPWGHTSVPHPREPEYQRLAAAFVQAQQKPYQAKQAHGFYPTQGDFDDWIDHELGSLAFTVEVGQLSARLLRPKLGLNPFWWMNPTEVDAAVQNLVPGVVGLLGRFAEAAPRSETQDYPVAAE